MIYRKILQFTNIMGITFPKEFTNTLKLKRGDLVEMYLKDADTIVIKRHKKTPKGITLND